MLSNVKASSDDKCLADFPLFMAYFRKYKHSLSSTDKIYQELKVIVNAALDYDMDKLDMESMLFVNKQNMEGFFNFIDLSFQLFTQQIN